VHFARVAGARCARPALTFDAAAMGRLRAHRWPGNVRELANALERLTILCAGGAAGPADVDAVLGPAGRGEPDLAADAGLSEALDAYERGLITRALEEAAGNVAEAARRLGTDRGNLYRRMRRLGLSR
jgi:two-component system nitrogen regulation response regulator NtrX